MRTRRASLLLAVVISLPTFAWAGCTGLRCVVSGKGLTAKVRANRTQLFRTRSALVDLLARVGVGTSRERLAPADIKPNASAPWLYSISPPRLRAARRCPSQRAGGSVAASACIGSPASASINDPAHNMGVPWPRGSAAALLSAAAVHTLGRGPSKAIALDDAVSPPSLPPT